MTSWDKAGTELAGVAGQGFLVIVLQNSSVKGQKEQLCFFCGRRTEGGHMGTNRARKKTLV